MKKLLYVMNPNAGMRRANRYLTEILGVFCQAGYDVTVHITSAPGEAAQVVAQRGGSVDLVVCCGGDGTFNETVSGMLRGGWDTPIGYIPAGSTNDFAASLGLSNVPVQAAKDIVEGTAVAYDVGRFGDRVFTYIASFGAFTQVSYNTPQNVKNAIGHAAYLLGGITEISQIRNIHMRLELDNGVIEDDFAFGAISNSTSVAGILSLDPNHVDMKDGLFELLLIRCPKTLVELTECIQALQSQKYEGCDLITFCKAKQIRVFAEPGLAWSLDGERAQSGEETGVENIHLGIRILQREARV